MFTAFTFDVVATKVARNLITFNVPVTELHLFKAVALVMSFNSRAVRWCRTGNEYRSEIVKQRS